MDRIGPMMIDRGFGIAWLGFWLVFVLWLDK